MRRFMTAAAHRSRTRATVACLFLACMFRMRHSFIADHFSRPGRAVGHVSVCVCVCMVCV